ncbi:hypothetical protein Vi05172_g7372 [Venturia inaequalis]|nr:hypothetical protein Vi05172_g7372 [Venturia inaequalis]
MPLLLSITAPISAHSLRSTPGHPHCGTPVKDNPQRPAISALEKWLHWRLSIGSDDAIPPTRLPHMAVELPEDPSTLVQYRSILLSRCRCNSMSCCPSPGGDAISPSQELTGRLSLLEASLNKRRIPAAPLPSTR